jgi:hypothetical protein
MGFNLGRAFGGALSGGIAGSSMGPWGALGGAVLGGGISGMASGTDSRGHNEFRAVDPNTGRDAAAQMQRGQLLQRLQMRAEGQGPSLAQMQANQALTQGRQQLESMAVSDRRNPALARRNAMIQGGQLSARIQGQAMMGRLAEQQQAEAALAQAIHNAQVADVQRAAVIEGARSSRFKELQGTPTSGETTTNMLSQVVPQAGQLWEAIRKKNGAPAAPYSAPAPIGGYGGLPGLQSNLDNIYSV